MKGRRAYRCAGMVLRTVYLSLVSMCKIVTHTSLYTTCLPARYSDLLPLIFLAVTLASFSFNSALWHATDDIWYRRHFCAATCSSMGCVSHWLCSALFSHFADLYCKLRINNCYPIWCGKKIVVDLTGWKNLTAERSYILKVYVFIKLVMTRDRSYILYTV